MEPISEATPLAFTTAKHVDTSQTIGNSSAPEWMSLVRIAFVLFGVSVFGISLVLSRNWPLLHDAAIMHYVVFLMDHGWRPYSDIIDINMPGSYMVEWFAVHVFGGGDSGLRLFNIATMIVVIASCIGIAPSERWAGFLSGVSICVLHLSNGPEGVGERDWYLMVCLLSGSAFFLTAMRKKQPYYMLLCAMFSTYAATIKPPVILFLCGLLVVVCLRLRLRQPSTASYLRNAFAGAAIPIVLVAGFLLRYKDLHSFLTIAAGLVPFYASHTNHPLTELLRVALTASMLLLAAFAVIVGSMARTWIRLDTQVMVLGFVVGLFLFLIQGKGWQYHKETMIAFMLVWITLQFAAGMRLGGKNRVLGVLGVALLCLLVGRYTLYIKKAPVDMAGTLVMQASINQLGGPALSGDIECMEMVDGCINALYNLRLLPSNGFIFDPFLFTRTPTPAIEVLRTRFLDEMTHKTPRVIILAASQWDTGIFTFDRLEQWPAFTDFLSRRYNLDSEHLNNTQVALGSYRVYIKK